MMRVKKKPEEEKKKKMAADLLPSTTTQFQQRKLKKKEYEPKLLQWVSIQSANASGQTLIKHPRTGHITIDPRKIVIPSEIYGDLTTWYTQNIIDYIRYPDRWSGYLHPHKMLMAWGPAGMGRSVYTASWCKINGINLVYVTSYFYSSQRIMALVELAMTQQPCLLYFDNASYLFRDKNLLATLYASFKASINLRETQVWCVLSFGDPLLSLDPMAHEMIDEFGTVVKILPSLKSSQYTSFIPYIINSILGDDEFTSDQSWAYILSRFVSAAPMCTFKEIYDVFFQLIVRHRKKQGASLEFVEIQPSDFTKALDTLPYLYNTPTHTLSSVDCEKRYEEATSTWDTFLQTKSPNFSLSTTSSSSSSSISTTTTTTSLISSTPPLSYFDEPIISTIPHSSLSSSSSSSSYPQLPLLPIQRRTESKHPRTESIDQPSKHRYEQPVTRACNSGSRSEKRSRIQKQVTHLPHDFDTLF